MADGSTKNIEDIREGDVVLTFNHETGRLASNPVMYAYCSDTPECAFTLRFSNGAELSVVRDHDLFEQESLTYVTILEDNAREFIGKHFYSVATETYVELIDVIYETQPVDYYELYTAKAYNMIANGMLNAASDVSYMLGIYEYGEDLKANTTRLAKDICEFGLFKYATDLGYSRQEFDNWNTRYVNIVLGKGLATWDDLWGQHSEYLVERSGAEASKCA